MHYDVIDLDINDCDPSPCENRGTCEDLVNGYRCQCMDGYTGKTWSFCSTKQQYLNYET